MWLRNCWYVIAWDHEIPAADDPKLFTRTVLGEPVLVYRTGTGDIVALEDRCCHRHAPLSVGRREGDCVRCGYHGLKFDPQGHCVEAPGIEIVPAKACVHRYPVAVRNRWVFVWMGDPAKADVALLPDNFSCDHPDWKNRPGYLHYDTPYLLICDNLLDFSHLSYVHEKSLGGSTRIAQSRPVIEPVPGATADWPQMGIRVSRHVNDVPPPPFYQRFRQFDTNLDRWFVYEFLLPGTLLMHSGGRPTGAAPDAPGPSVRLHSCQTLTPETTHTTHYFFQQSHPANEGDDTVTESIYNSLIGAFNEDRDMITAQHRNILLSSARPMMPLAMDAALIQFRRLLEARVHAEHSAAIASPHPALTT
ncbi:vanillate O-demethylase monooxygenase subunit [Hydrogenophaga palleronii]|uniref:Vanillate O-demethylase monooxygenase subunit n=1 Tax=Hydrogenophaga palleronii TaxID=65655 RepID=A0ABU1WUK1_9BURK|nr:aromatic ring-hydroxylating dioxygenase subunit alpha [Hydrogenophaga palleronii]MDR7152537.1 vanillate O-demethylase monooxygenase subunit [Hydrogenophaga palleronii]